MFSFFKRKKEEPAVKHSVKKRDFTFREEEAETLLQDIKREYGLDYQKQRFVTLKKIEKFALQNELYSFSQMLEKIKSSMEMKRKLVNMLTVGETYFYRETGHFEILSRLYESHAVSDILVAPSSSGEEAYSILLYLLHAGKDVSNLRIRAIDINSDSIEAAKRGVYSQRSVSQLPKELLEKYFTQVDADHYAIDDALKRKIDFEQKNIFDITASSFSRFDAIFCRNMLIYFEDEQKKEVLRTLHELLRPNGVLFLGHADISFTPENFYKHIDPQGVYYTPKR